MAASSTAASLPTATSGTPGVGLVTKKEDNAPKWPAENLTSIRQKMQATEKPAEIDFWRAEYSRVRKAQMAHLTWHKNRLVEQNKIQPSIYKDCFIQLGPHGTILNLLHGRTKEQFLKLMRGSSGLGPSLVLEFDGQGTFVVR
jgi:hypothetical protein